MLFVFGGLLPCIIFFAKRLPVSDKAGTVLVEKHLALVALETGRVPLEVRGHPEDVLEEMPTLRLFFQRHPSFMQ